MGGLFLLDGKCQLPEARNFDIIRAKGSESI